MRVRHKVGTWRVTVDSDSLVSDLMRSIEASHSIPISEQRLTLDPKGEKAALEASMSLGSQGLTTNGAMVFLHTTRTLSAGGVGGQRAVRRTIGSDGSIVAQEYESYSNAKGFRPGMAALGDIRKSWTLSDFLAMDEKFNFKIKRQETADCSQASLDAASCVSFQAYVQQLGWRQGRFGYLYGTIDEHNKVLVECVYEPPQSGSEFGFQALDDPLLERVEAVSQMLGLKRVGWIFAHPPREEGFVFSGAEVIQAAELQLEAADGVARTPFVTVKVTVNQQAEANFEAYQVSLQCMAMVAEGALGTLDDNLAACAVHPTFTAIVEGKRADSVDNNFFLCNVPVVQHQSPKFTAGASFPKLNRLRALSPDDLGGALTKPQPKSLVNDVLADFGLVLYLASLPQVFDQTTFLPALCDAIKANQEGRQAALDDGYRLILFSFAGLDDF